MTSNLSNAVAAVLMVAGCASQAPDEALEPAEPPFETCLALPPPLPKVRTVEAVKRRAEAVEHVALDCSERLRRVIAAWPR